MIKAELMLKKPEIAPRIIPVSSNVRPMDTDPLIEQILKKYDTRQFGPREALVIGDRIAELGKTRMVNVQNFPHHNLKQANIDAAIYFAKAMMVYDLGARSGKAWDKMELLQARMKKIRVELSKCKGRFALYDNYIEI